MPSSSTLLAFAAAAFLLVALPGPNLFYLEARSISEGRRGGIVSALGLETGTLVHITAAAAGLSALLASSATAFTFVKYAGAAYLVYLGIRALLAGEPADRSRPASPAGTHVYGQAITVQLLNPKVAVFYLAFLPQFVDPDRPAASQVAVLGAVIVAIGAIVHIALALVAGSAAQRLRSDRSGHRWWSRRASGCLYLAMGAFAALSPAQRAR
jgi:threonine/homoserine/homoserine lactone efflux protein